MTWLVFNWGKYVHPWLGIRLRETCSSLIISVWRLIWILELLWCQQNFENDLLVKNCWSKQHTTSNSKSDHILFCLPFERHKVPDGKLPFLVISNIVQGVLLFTTTTTSVHFNSWCTLGHKKLGEIFLDGYVCGTITITTDRCNRSVNIPSIDIYTHNEVWSLRNICIGRGDGRYTIQSLVLNSSETAC